MRAISNILASLFLMFTVNVLAQPAATTRVIWHGHAAFEITTPNGKVLMIDPWLKNPVNPNAAKDKDPLAAIAKVDYILITHGHSDHVGEAVDLAKKTGARLVTNAELGGNLVKLLGYPKQQAGYDTLMNVGGEITIADGEVVIDMVPAVHSSGLGNPLAGEKEADIAYGGNPAGFVIKIKNGPIIYHTGDTAYFNDMSLIGELAPDLALINIGGHFGMEPKMAARAARAVRAKLMVPQHYASFPVLTQNTRSFTDELDKMRIRYKVMQPGTSLSFKGRKLIAE